MSNSSSLPKRFLFCLVYFATATVDYNDCDACMAGNECGDEDYDDCMENYMYDNCDDVCDEGTDAEEEEGSGDVTGTDCQTEANIYYTLHPPHTLPPNMPVKIMYNTAL